MRGVQVSFLGSARSPSTAHELRAGEKDGSRCPRGETVIHETAGFTWCAHRTTLLGMRPAHVHGLPLQASAVLHKDLLAQTCGFTSQLVLKRPRLPAQAESPTSGGLPCAPRKLLRDPGPHGVRCRSRGLLKLVSDDSCAGPTSLLWTTRQDHVSCSCQLFWSSFFLLRAA